MVKIIIILKKDFMKLFIFMIVFISTMANAELKVGDSLPLITGQNQDDKSIETKSIKEKFILVYFYPKADTPGCTKQACSLRDSYTLLLKKNVKIFGVSTDGVIDQKAFQKKFNLPFDLIADTKKVWADAFQVSVTMGFASRQAFLFKDGKLVWLDTTASTSEQAKDVLDFLEKDQTK